MSGASTTQNGQTIGPGGQVFVPDGVDMIQAQQAMHHAGSNSPVMLEPIQSAFLLTGNSQRTLGLPVICSDD